MKQILEDIKEETDAITVWKFNIPLTSMDRSFRQNISKKTLALNDTSAQIKLIDILTVSSKTAE